MTDVILYNITYKPTCKKNTDYRIYQIQVVSFCCIEIISQEILYLMDKEFQY